MMKVDVKMVSNLVTAVANCMYGDIKRKEEMQNILIDLIHSACREYKNNKEFELELNEFVKFINK